MQYSAEVTYPTPEGTSNGLIQLFGQVAVVFVYVMSALRTDDGSFTFSLLLSAGLLLLAALVVSRLHDPDRRRRAGGRSRRRRRTLVILAADAAPSDPDAPPDAEPAPLR